MGTRGGGILLLLLLLLQYSVIAVLVFVLVLQCLGEGAVGNEEEGEGGEGAVDDSDGGVELDVLAALHQPDRHYHLLISLLLLSL